MSAKRPFFSFFLIVAALSTALLTAQEAANSKEEQVAGAYRAAAVLGEIQSRHQAGQTDPKSFFLTHEDVNALLELELAKAQVHGQAEAVESIRVDFLDGNRFVTHLTANMDKVNMSGGSLVVTLFRGLFAGRQRIEVEGELETSLGTGRYRVTKSRINGVAVPASVLELLLSRLGSQLDPPFDPTERFELRYGIREIEISEGQVTLLTGGMPAGNE